MVGDVPSLGKVEINCSYYHNCKIDLRLSLIRVELRIVEMGPALVVIPELTALGG